MEKATIFAFRRHFLVFLLVLGLCGLFVRAAYLQLFENDFLEGEGKARHLRVVEMPAYRGMISDRNGELLAVSTPVYSVWANPEEVLNNYDSVKQVAGILGLNTNNLFRKLQKKNTRRFLYVKRHITPKEAEQLKQISITGIYLQREYRRYYPTAEVSSHLLGFTDIDDKGLEGIELAYDRQLRGQAGAKKVIKDQLNRVIEDVEAIRMPKPGWNIELSFDHRVQYLAYRELKTKLAQYGASSASAVMIDSQTGEIIAMTNVPSYNPNNRKDYPGHTYRNRAVTDVFEPGSTIKPFTIAVALESNRYSPHTLIDTTPGEYVVGNHTIRDIKNYGQLTVSSVILKSSNVGATKIALTIPSQNLWSAFNDIGIGQLTESGFPGEVAGRLKSFQDWHVVEHATLAYGYGMSMTALQLARAYAVLASEGRELPVSMLYKSDADSTQHYSSRVFSPRTAKKIKSMLTAVVSDEGTGVRASIPGYSVAGKTGTVHKSAKGGYEKDKYLSLFAGMAPASDPRFVLVVVVNEPSKGEYFGGEVAAPIFAKIMSEALRIFNVAPDKIPLQENSLNFSRNRVSQVHANTI